MRFLDILNNNAMIFVMTHAVHKSRRNGISKPICYSQLQL